MMVADRYLVIGKFSCWTGGPANVTLTRSKTGSDPLQDRDQLLLVVGIGPDWPLPGSESVQVPPHTHTG